MTYSQFSSAPGSSANTDYSWDRKQVQNFSKNWHNFEYEQEGDQEMLNIWDVNNTLLNSHEYKKHITLKMKQKYVELNDSANITYKCVECS